MEQIELRVELDKSEIAPCLGKANFFAVKNEDYLISCVCQYLPNSERDNNHRLKTKWLNRYYHLKDGGWYCPLWSLEHFEPTDYCIVKPSSPREDKNGKLIKYETPAKEKTRTIVLDYSPGVIERIQQNYPSSDWDFIKQGQAVWRTVTKDNKYPVILTEGAKKTASVMSQGHFAVGFQGVWNFLDGNELKPNLKILAKEGRTFYIAYDQDTKFKTRRSVEKAITKLGHKLTEHKCYVKVMTWEPSQGKGIDDFLHKGGEIADLIDSALPFSAYLQKLNQRPTVLRSDQVADLLASDNSSIRLNTLTDQIEINGKPFSLNIPLKPYFYELTGYMATKEAWTENIEYLAFKNQYDPVEDYLNRVHKQYKGNYISLDGLADKFFKTSEPIYNVFLKKWLIGCVARALKHGCQLDNMLVLKGDQGKNKTRFFQTLAGDDFFDNSISNISDKDVYLIMHSAWIEELGELESITSKKLAGEVKQWATRRFDTFRKPYDRHAEKYPRRTAFCGTVNKNTFLIDDTGNRRFWVIPINNHYSIDIDMVKEMRDQLWASAVELYLNKEQWHLTPEETTIQEVENQAHQREHPWEEAITNYCNLKAMVNIDDIFDIVLDIPQGQRKPHQKEEITQLLLNCGFTVKKRLRVEGGRKYYLCQADNKPWEPEKGEESAYIMSDSPNGDRPIFNTLTTNQLLDKVEKIIKLIGWSQEELEKDLIAQTGFILLESLSPDVLVNYISHLEEYFTY